MPATEPLLLIPGTLCDERVFAPALIGLDVTSHAVPLEGTTTIPDMARLILAEAPARFALWGFSLGAMIALELLAQAPGRVTRLALMGANAGTLSPEKAEARRAAWRLARQRGAGAFVDATWDAAIPVHARADQNLRARLHAMANDTPERAFADQVEMAINRRDHRPLLGAISVPTLVTVGDEDHICPPSLATEIATAIPNARLEIIPGAGHYASLDQPQAVGRALQRWLAAPVLPISEIPFKELK